MLSQALFPADSWFCFGLRSWIYLARIAANEVYFGFQLLFVAFLTEADPIQRTLFYIGEPATPPRIAPARAPPDWLEADFDQTIIDESEEVEPVPGFEFDQTVNW